MADLSTGVQSPGLGGATPSYQTCSASDYFTAQPSARYILHYKNGATPTGALKVTDQVTQAPAGTSPAAGWADVAHTSSSLAASTERIVDIPNSNRFRDANGRIQLAHTTPTTLTVLIMGPFPAS